MADLWHCSTHITTNISHLQNPSLLGLHSPLGILGHSTPTDQLLRTPRLQRGPRPRNARVPMKPGICNKFRYIDIYILYYIATSCHIMPYIMPYYVVLYIVVTYNVILCRITKTYFALFCQFMLHLFARFSTTMISWDVNLSKLTSA